LARPRIQSPCSAGQHSGGVGKHDCLCDRKPKAQLCARSSASGRPPTSAGSHPYRAIHDLRPSHFGNISASSCPRTLHRTTRTPRFSSKSCLDRCDSRHIHLTGGRDSFNYVEMIGVDVNCKFFDPERIWSNDRPCFPGGSEQNLQYICNIFCRLAGSETKVLGYAIVDSRGPCFLRAASPLHTIFAGSISSALLKMLTMRLRAGWCRPSARISHICHLCAAALRCACTEHRAVNGTISRVLEPSVCAEARTLHSSAVSVVAANTIVARNAVGAGAHAHRCVSGRLPPPTEPDEQ
jgi:hypothetical protein